MTHNEEVWGTKFILDGNCPLCKGKLQEINLKNQKFTCRILCLDCKLVADDFKILKEKYKEESSENSIEEVYKKYNTKLDKIIKREPPGLYKMMKEE